MTTLTANQQAVYDRQLRVWGLHVQQRLQQARILIIGENCLAAEVAKNLVLAGVGTIQVFSSTSCFTSTSTGNYLASINSPSKTEMFVRTLREMNPHVTVSLLEADGFDKHLVAELDLVVQLTGTMTEQIYANQICNIAGVKYSCATATGPFGWMFLDLGHYTYMRDDEDKKDEVTLNYIPLDKALSADGDSQQRRIHNLYFILKVCNEFEKAKGRAPGYEDLNEVVKSATAVLSPEGVEGKRSLDSRMLRLYLQHKSEFPPVCDIMGGMLANEVVKIVSYNGDPIQNFFFYDLFDGKGILNLIE